MIKKYIVRLCDEERQLCTEIVKKYKGTSQKVRRAQILLMSDAKIADAFGCRIRTIEKLCKRLVTDGFAIALNGKKRPTSPTEPILDGRGEAKLIVLSPVRLRCRLGLHNDWE